jgi:hypothetical protein
VNIVKNYTFIPTTTVVCSNGATFVITGKSGIAFCTDNDNGRYDFKHYGHSYILEMNMRYWKQLNAWVLYAEADDKDSMHHFDCALDGVWMGNSATLQVIDMYAPHTMECAGNGMNIKGTFKFPEHNPIRGGK